MYAQYAEYEDAGHKSKEKEGNYLPDYGYINARIAKGNYQGEYNGGQDSEK
jgi:hypothetical protein